VIGLVVNGLYDAIKAAVADFLATFPQAEADIEGEDDGEENGKPDSDDS
jgi:hypothetical protein